MRRALTRTTVLCAAIFALAGGAAAMAQEVVKVTPLGGVEGEFCRFDRALIFEDPTGTRILYDAGRTVAGPGDPRLGEIDIVLVSHMHGDHVGDRHISAPNAGSCAEPDLAAPVVPNLNSTNIAVAKDALVVTGSEMEGFLAGKLEAAGGDRSKSQRVRFGGNRTVGGVDITTVPAVHSNGVSPAFIGGELGDLMKAAGIAGYVGPPTGYVLTFSNGLVVYLSGDTGITAEQDSVVRGHYGAELVVMNIGDINTTGPTEAAYVVDELVKPAAVIASHANEEATRDGEVLPDTKTAAFIAATRTPVHLPLSGRTMSFNDKGKCTDGC